MQFIMNNNGNNDNNYGIDQLDPCIYPVAIIRKNCNPLAIIDVLNLDVYTVNITDNLMSLTQFFKVNVFFVNNRNKALLQHPQLMHIYGLALTDFIRLAFKRFG